jgi:16S rRNA (guanine1516-N2)-methyltransferase|tara:strand:+ start:1752 stop:2492 length:741 start_codon:yes stop_codon:yes gene_type:complete
MLSTVIYDVDSLKLKAQVIADQLSLQSLSKKEALRSIKAREEGYYLKVEKLRCYLQLGLRSKTKPIYCNFSEWAENNKKSNLIRCMKGLPMNCTVLDATAGFGRDSLELASVSKSVTLVERLPWMAFLLEDGLKNTKEEPALSLIKKFNVFSMDSYDFLDNDKNNTDVVYLDPMFPKTGSAKAKKSIQALRELTKEDLSDGLLPLALSYAKKRVIVKRHKNSQHLDQKKPTFSISSRVVRFDVYEV